MTPEEKRERERARAAAYYQKHRDRILARRLERADELKRLAKHRRELNKEHIKTKNKEYYAENRDAVRQQQKVYQEQNRGRRRLARAAYRAANHEKILVALRRHYQENRASYRAYYQANREAILVKDRERKAANADRYRSYVDQRRAREQSAAVVEDVKRQAIWHRDGGICYICGGDADENNWHMEHTIPLHAEGAEHSYRNVGVSCPPCNLRKHRADPRTDDEWNHLLAVVQEREARHGLVLEYLDALKKLDARRSGSSARRPRSASGRGGRSSW